MKEFLFTVEIWISAESVYEAEAIYRSGDWTPDGHTIITHNENGDEVELAVPEIAD